MAARPLHFLAVATTIVLLPALMAVPAAAQPSHEKSDAGGYESESARLSKGLAHALRTAGFDDLVDFDLRNYAGAAQPAEFLPNVDVAVIELSPEGTVTGAANVLYDRDSPRGYRVGIDARSLQTKGVEFARWRLERWDDQALWDAGPAAEDVLTHPTVVKKQYMESYPASVLKVMVGYSVLKLVDKGEITLDTPVVYHEVDGRSCAYGPSNPEGLDPAPVADGATDSVSGWFDQMITVSDNFATCVLLQLINDKGAIASSNQHFADLGLATLRMFPSQPDVGSGWSSGTMTMGALDTARLMLLVTSAKGRLWTTPAGRAVSAHDLSPASKQFFRSTLAEQSFNEVLATGNLCGSSDAVAGIPSKVSRRWIDPSTGHVVTYDGDLVIDFGYDVRPCNATAEVTFKHKTGLTYNAGSDTGIVRALPGQDGRWYVISVQSNVGNRFGDPDWADSDPNACEGAPYVCYPRAFGRLGHAIDSLVKDR